MVDDVDFDVFEELELELLLSPELELEFEDFDGEEENLLSEELPPFDEDRSLEEAEEDEKDPNFDKLEPEEGLLSWLSRLSLLLPSKLLPLLEWLEYLEEPPSKCGSGAETTCTASKQQVESKSNNCRIEIVVIIKCLLPKIK